MIITMIVAVVIILALAVAAWDYSNDCGCEGAESCDKCQNPLGS